MRPIDDRLWARQGSNLEPTDYENTSLARNWRNSANPGSSTSSRQQPFGTNLARREQEVAPATSMRKGSVKTEVPVQLHAEPGLIGYDEVPVHGHGLAHQ